MRYEERQDQLQLILYSAVSWMSICLLIETTISFKFLSKKKAHDLKNRIVSIIHGLYCLILTGYHLFYDQPSYTQQSSDMQHFIVLTSMGYFVYDFIACEFLGISDIGVVVHHSLAIAGYASCEYYGNATMSLVGLFLAEVSNAPMHARAILRTLGKRYTKLYELFELIYLTFYIVARGIFITKMIYDCILISEIPILLRITGLGLWVQSVYYIREMSNILKRKLKQERERKLKGVNYFWLSENPDLSKLSYFKKEAKDVIF